MTLLNAALLFGLAAVLIPPIVHLFNRRRYDEVDWAAMQFLRVSPTVRRKVIWEQVLLMLLRMGLLAGLVLALAAPELESALLGRISPPGEADYVLILDGSASMGYRPPTPAADAAREWAARFLDDRDSGSRIAIVQARQKPALVQPTLTTNHAQARNALELLAPPGGSADWPAAVQTAQAILQESRTARHIVILSDNQRYGWADEATLTRWDLLRRSLTADPAGPPRLWVVNVAPDRPTDPPNWSLEPLTTSRAIAATGRDVPFRSALRFSGPGDGVKPEPVKLEVDGRAVGEIPTEESPSTEGALPLRFSRKFTAGSHVVTLKLPPDDLPADNRQDFALEVLPVIPVLIVDGDPAAAPLERGSDFLRDALAPAKDPTPAFAVRVIPVSDFRPAVFGQDVRGPGTPPRVVILANLERLTTEQQQSLERYLTDGGSVLVLLGHHADPATWNRVAFRGGQGFLPARVGEPIGTEQLAGAPSPNPASFTHPATEVFREPLPGGLHTAVFPRRWKLDLAAGVNGVTGSAVARLSTGEPLLVERGFGTGRVIVSAVPLDASWGTNLPRLPDFVRLAHELLYFLIAARTADRNVDAAQPLVFTPHPPEPPGPVTILAPNGQSRAVPTDRWPAVIDGPHEPGAYRLTTPGGRTHYFAVRPDPREAVLTPCTDEDRQKVADTVGNLWYITSADEITNDPGGPGRRELWWLLLLVVLLLLGCEVWYTRRLTARSTVE